MKGLAPSSPDIANAYSRQAGIRIFVPPHDHSGQARHTFPGTRNPEPLSNCLRICYSFAETNVRGEPSNSLTRAWPKVKHSIPTLWQT